jgi:hypothetical protein
MLLDPEDPATFINADIKAALQEMCRQTTFDTLTRKATRSYDGGQVLPGDEIPPLKDLWPFLGYFKAFHSTECTNRYADHRGHTHNVTGTTDPQGHLCIAKNERECRLLKRWLLEIPRAPRNPRTRKAD